MPRTKPTTATSGYGLGLTERTAAAPAPWVDSSIGRSVEAVAEGPFAATGAFVGFGLVVTDVDFGVGFGVGLGVGAGVGRGVGFGVGPGVGRGVGVGVGFGLCEGFGAASRVMSSDGWGRSLAAIGALKPAVSASTTAAVARHALASFDIVRVP